MAAPPPASPWSTLELVEEEDAAKVVAALLPPQAEHLVLPGYLMVRGVNGQLPHIATHPLVRRLLPGLTPHREVERARRGLAAEEGPAPDVASGDDVEVLEGPAAGMGGLVVDIAGDAVSVQLTLRRGATVVVVRLRGLRRRQPT